MKQLTLGLAVIYAGGDVAAALQAAEKAGAPIALDDMMAARLSVARDWPATVTRVNENGTVDLELQGVPDGQPRQRFAVQLGTGSNTIRFTGDNAGANRASGSDDLESMTVAQLTDLAAERKVEIPSGAKKADIIAALQAA